MVTNYDSTESPCIKDLVVRGVRYFYYNTLITTRELGSVSICVCVRACIRVCVCVCVYIRWEGGLEMVAEVMASAILRKGDEEGVVDNNVNDACYYEYDACYYAYVHCIHDIRTLYT